MDQKAHRINERIRAREVRVIDEDGTQLGIMPPSQALTLAEQKGLDLVEIAANASPPVCRIMNSGKYFYQQAKRDAEARKRQKYIQVKEIKFRPKIDEHDFQFKRRNAERFLLEGNKVKATVVFRGRERAHTEIGEKILIRLAEELMETAVIENNPKQEGNIMTQILGPKREIVAKQKGQKATSSNETANKRALRAETEQQSEIGEGTEDL